jgi:IclR family acetate operon transcriptional repressor
LAPGIHSVVPSLSVAKLMRLASPRLQELSRTLGETVSLAALFDNRMEVIAVNESPQMIRMTNVVGHILPPNGSSLGKAIAAFQSDERRQKLLRSFGIYRFTEHTITDRAELEREFGRVREQGYSTDREESVPGGNCFGVPILAAGGEVNAAISASMPKIRLTGEGHERSIVGMLREAAADIATDLKNA